MEYKVLYRKHRPIDFENVVGQDYIVKTLKKSISSAKTAHAYIFTGPRGTGKTSVAKIFSKAVNCENNKSGNPCGKCESCLNFENNADIVEIDAASNNGVDEIRELINNIHLAPAYSKYKVYIIDEVHMLTGSAFNALLLTLEEPPSYVIFILATTEIQNVPITVLSRCQRYDFKKINNKSMIERLKVVAKEEKIKITDEALEEIAYISEGGMRDALGVLEQLVEKDDKNITLEEVVEGFGTISVKSIKELINLLEKSDYPKIIDYLNELSTSGVNFRLFVGKLIEQLKEVAVKLKINTTASSFDYGTLKDLIFELNECQNNIRNSTNPYILMELILLNYVNFEEGSSEQIIIPVNKTSESIDTEEKKVPVEEKETKTNVGHQNEIVEIRVNNCFVGAKKEFLEEMKIIWQDFLLSLKKIDKKLLSTLIESNIVAASNKFAIIATKNESTSHLINEELNDISKYFKDFNKKSYQFIAISEDSWQKEKKKYAEQIKSGYEYILIDEKKVIKPVKKTLEIELIAQDIFGGKLEIK